MLDLASASGWRGDREPRRNLIFPFVRSDRASKLKPSILLKGYEDNLRTTEREGFWGSLQDPRQVRAKTKCTHGSVPYVRIES